MVKNFKVVSETVEQTGGGFDYLVYEVSAEENGKKSVFFITEDFDTDGIIARRASILDPSYETGSEEWTHAPKEIIESDEFAPIRDEIKNRTKDYFNGSYQRIYPERKYFCNWYECFADECGNIFRYVFRIVREGETVYFGCPVEPKSGEPDTCVVKKAQGQVFACMPILTQEEILRLAYKGVFDVIIGKEWSMNDKRGDEDVREFVYLGKTYELSIREKGKGPQASSATVDDFFSFLREGFDDYCRRNHLSRG